MPASTIDFDTVRSIGLVTDHYVGCAAVLVRLSRIKLDLLRDLLGMAYKFVAGKTAAPLPKRKRRPIRTSLRK